MPSFNNREHAAFLFDMDGTMLDSSAVVGRVWTAWAEKVGIDPIPLLEACHGVQGKDLIRRFGGKDLDLAVEMEWLQAAEMADVDGIVAIDGIAAFVDRLDHDRWAIVTSAPRDLAIKRLGAVGLPLPKIMVAAEDVTLGKPDPEGFLMAADRLGVEIRDCLIFEDSPAGIASAKASGANIVIVGNLVKAETNQMMIANYL